MSCNRQHSRFHRQFVLVPSAQFLLRHFRGWEGGGRAIGSATATTTALTVEITASATWLSTAKAASTKAMKHTKTTNQVKKQEPLSVAVMLVVTVVAVVAVGCCWLPSFLILFPHQQQQQETMNH